MSSMPESMAAAQRAYDRIANPKKVAAGLREPQHRGKRVVPVLEKTTLREIYSVIESGELVVIATIRDSGEVEYGMLQGGGDFRNADPEDKSLDTTMGETIHKAVNEGEPTEYPFGSDPSLKRPTTES